MAKRKTYTTRQMTFGAAAVEKNCRKCGNSCKMWSLRGLQGKKEYKCRPCDIVFT